MASSIILMEKIEKIIRIAKKEGFFILVVKFMAV